MSKKTQIYTNIEDYVRAQYPAVANLFDFCHLFNLVHPRPGSGGIALIIPNEKYLKVIAENSTSENSESVGKACDALLALIIRGDLDEASKWSSADIGNMRYPSQRIIGVPSGAKVELQHKGKTYATIERDKGFRPGYRKNISIWKMTSGESMYDGSDAEILRKTGTPRKKGTKLGEGISGGYKVTEKNISQLRFKIALSAENEYLIQRQSQQYVYMEQQSITSTSTGMTSQKIITEKNLPLPPFIAYVISFARFVAARDPETFYGAILPLIRFRITDFYFIFEPHRFPGADDDFLIPTKLIEEWWTSFEVMTTFPQNLLEFRNWIDSELKKATSHEPEAAIYKCSDSNTALCEAIDADRTQISGNMQTFSQLVESVEKAYQQLDARNSIGDVSNVFPRMLANYYKNHPGFKQAQDELAFTIEQIFSKFCGSFDQNAYKTAINMLGNLLHASNSNEIRIRLPLLGKNRAAFFDQIKANISLFINSTMFLWVPIHTHLMKNYPIESTPDPTSVTPEALYNADLALNLEHTRLYNDTKITEQQQNIVIQVLESIGTKVSPELRAKIQTIAQS